MNLLSLMQHRSILEDNKSIVEVTLLSMDDGAYKERIAALLKVIQVSKILKVDNIPCQIEEVMMSEIVLAFCPK